MKKQEAELLLKKTFGHNNFHSRQWETIERILDGKRVLLIEKTGFGKSLCYQFPATIFSGITVIFSPLIALMRDQVKKLNSLGINARCINSEQTAEENSQIIRDAKQGKLKILYIAPERQENTEWIDAVSEMNLSMVVVDEAHCISVWGHDFRPAFRRIASLIRLLPSSLPVLAATATATKKVEEDIALQIGGNIEIIRGNLMRDNFRLYVIRVQSEDEKMIWLGGHIEKIPGSGIIYTGTRVNTEIYSRWFEHLNISAVGYNAGLDTQTRKDIEAGLMNNKWKCVISTNALGMGIDKPDIKFIIHTQIPQSPIHYYQEIGRAGRDNDISYLILFYTPEDKKLPEAFINTTRPSASKYEQAIRALRLEMLSERDLMKRINLKQNPVRVIKSDLIEQGIIREVTLGKRKVLEYVYNSPPLNTAVFEELRQAKMRDLDKMIEYVETKGSRMKYLCDYLGDTSRNIYDNCDNTRLKKRDVSVTPEWSEKIERFWESFFPEIKVETRGSNIINGIAASYYGVSNVGTAIHTSKYENGGEFPDFLLVLTLKAYRKKFGGEKFDLIVYVPPSVSGGLVKNFAAKISKALKFPVSHNLLKLRVTKEQKEFENGYLKTENVKGAFGYTNPAELKGKSILIIDDISDSGATMKELGRFFTHHGASKIAPLVIAKTVGGDIV